MHHVDTTLFYSPDERWGNERYLSAKHAWLAAHTSWEHTIVVPGQDTHTERGGVCTLSGHPVPGTFNYRLPLNPRRWSRLLESLEPTSSRRATPSIRPGAPGASRAGAASGSRHSSTRTSRRSWGGVTRRRCRVRAMRRYVRWLYERFDVVFAPSRLMCEYLSPRSSACSRSCTSRSASIQKCSAPGAPRATPLPADVSACRRCCAGGGERGGASPEEKNLPVLLQAFARTWVLPTTCCSSAGSARTRPALNPSR